MATARGRPGFRLRLNPGYASTHRPQSFSRRLLDANPRRRRHRLSGGRGTARRGRSRANGGECNERAGFAQRRAAAPRRAAAAARELAAVGARTSPSARGERCARTTARTATPGSYFDHDQARSRAYRWNEDGLGGICDEEQRLCFALALWNGKDPMLKERAFGLTGSQGNHGEDVKEYFFYLDATPSHSYLRYLYKYPQAEYPYAALVAGERAPLAATSRRSRCSTPASSTTAATGTSRCATPRRRRTRSTSGSSPPTAGPTPPRCTSCPRCGSATRGRGATTARQAARCAEIAAGRGRARGPCAPTIRRWARTSSTAAHAADDAVHREREQRAAAVGRAPMRRPR